MITLIVEPRRNDIEGLHDHSEAASAEERRHERQQQMVVLERLQNESPEVNELRPNASVL